MRPLDYVTNFLKKKLHATGNWCDMVERNTNENTSVREWASVNGVYAAIVVPLKINPLNSHPIIFAYTYSGFCFTTCWCSVFLSFVPLLLRASSSLLLYPLAQIWNCTLFFFTSFGVLVFRFLVLFFALSISKLDSFHSMPKTMWCE